MDQYESNLSKGISPQRSSAHIRPARMDEAEVLTGLAIRSKAYWGYSDEFLAAVQSDMTITLAQVATEQAFVLELDETVAGFYKLREVTSEQVELTDLFIDPLAIGRGFGRLLWGHAVTTARSMGYIQMTFESDPNAEGFYLRMGQRVWAR